MNGMQLTPSTRALVDRVVNVFQTGAVRGDYGALYTLRNGPHGLRQIIYGRARTREFDKLRLLVLRYAQAKGTFSNDLGQYLWRVGALPLYDDLMFRTLLRRAGRRAGGGFCDLSRVTAAPLCCHDTMTRSRRGASSFRGFSSPRAACGGWSGGPGSSSRAPVVRAAFPVSTCTRMAASILMRIRSPPRRGHEWEVARGASCRARSPRPVIACGWSCGARAAGDGS